MLKGAVIGLGKMGIVHFSILNTHPDVAFAAACDASKLVARQFGRHMGIPAFTDCVEMLDLVELDFVLVATPSWSHVDISSTAWSCSPAATRPTPGRPWPWG